MLCRYPTRPFDGIPSRGAVGIPILPDWPGMGAGVPPRLVCETVLTEVKTAGVGFTTTLKGGILSPKKIVTRESALLAAWSSVLMAITPLPEMREC